MISFFRHLHSGLAYLVLLALIISVLVFLFKWLGSKEFGKGDKVLALLTLIFSHLQLVFGLILYFFGPLGIQLFGTEGLMKNSDMRLYAVEHISVNIIGIVLITLGYSKAKRLANSKKKFSNLTVFYLLGLVLILSRIPWDAWLG